MTPFLIALLLALGCSGSLVLSEGRPAGTVWICLAPVEMPAPEPQAQRWPG